MAAIPVGIVTAPTAAADCTNAGACHRVCAGHSPGRWSYDAPTAGPYYPGYCADPWYCDDGWDLDVDSPIRPGRPGGGIGPALSKVPYHPRNQGVSNVLP